MSKQTIPRLELLSSLLASRLTESVKKAMGEIKSIDLTTYWSDSTVVLSWIRNSNKEYKQFVENRLQEIRKLASSGVTAMTISDHNLIYGIRKFKTFKQAPKFIEYRDFKHFNEQNFLWNLASISYQH